MIDLTASELEVVQRIVDTHVPDLDVWVFGPRAGGRRKPWSDLDLAIVSSSRIAHALMTAIEWDFEESDLPFKVDVTDLAAVSPEFRSRIEASHVLLPRLQRTQASG